MTQHRNSSLKKSKTLYQSHSTFSIFTRSSDSKNAPTTRGLKFESLENRELLSATTWESPAAASVAENPAIVQASDTLTAPISLATLDVTVEKIEATPAAVGSNKANIEWTSVEGASKYYLMSCTSTDGEVYSAWTSLKNVDDPGDGSDTVSTQLTLAAGKYYKFKVRAVIGDDRTDFTETEEAIVVDKPDSPVITNATVDRATGIATLEFDTIDNASFYRVDYTSNDGATWQFAKYIYVGDGEATSSKIYIDTDADSAVLTQKLGVNKTYQFRVRAANDCGCSEYTVSEAISYKGATAPESVTAQVTEGSHYATIAWSASEDATQYYIEATTNGGESWSGVKKASADSFTYDEATDTYSYTYYISTGKTYQYRVRAYNELGSDGNATVSEEVALLTPETPENFTITSAEAVNPTNYPVGERYSKVTVTLSWEPADNATKYVVRYSKDGGSEKLLKNINDPTVTSVTFGALAGSYYNFSIIAVNSLGASEAVETGVFGVYKATLNRVDVVEGEILEATTVAPTGVATVYQWQYRTADGDWADIAGATESSYTPTAEDVANLYWIRALVSGADDYCPAGSYVAEAVAAPVVTSLNAPSDFTLGKYNLETHALQMSWVDNADNEDGFYVEYSADGGANWAKAAWLDADVTERVGAVYEGNDYLYRVRAYNADGYSDWAYSDPFEVKPETPSLRVTTLEDVVDEYDNVISLREAIAYASQYSWLGDQITFDAKLNGQTITVTDGELLLEQTLTFNASDQNITVSGENKSRIFNVTEYGVTFKGLTFVNGTAPDSATSKGGAVYIASRATANFDDCAFENNYAYSEGGAVYADSLAAANFNCCVFTNNSARQSGGVLSTSSHANVTFTNSVLSGNSARNAGAINAYDSSTLTLQHVTIVNNSATFMCGGLWIDTDVTANIYNSIIYGNTATRWYANLHATDSTVTASNLLTYTAGNAWNCDPAATMSHVIDMADNTSLASVLDPTTFELVKGSAAIDAGDHELTPSVTNDLIGNERDETPDLGAYEFIKPEAPSLCVTTIDDVVDEYDNQISLREAIAYASQYPELGYEITFDSSLNGQTITLTDGELVVSQSLSFIATDQNITVSGDNKSRIFTVSANDVAFEGLIFTKGLANSDSDGFGGAVYVSEGFDASFDSCSFTNNSARFGGSVYLASNASATLTESAISFSSATENGGGVFVASGATAKLVNSVVSDGTAKDGAAVYAEDYAVLTLSQVKVADNKVTDTGGAIYVRTYVTATFEDCAFTGNSSTGYGGSVYASGSSTLSIARSVFTGNSTQTFGGAVHIEGDSTGTFVNSVFNGNKAFYGGAIAVSSASVKLQHVTIVGNVASIGGGVWVSFAGESQLYNSIIYGNTSSYNYAHNVFSVNSTLTASNNLTCTANNGWYVNGGSVTNLNVVEMSDNASLSSVLDSTTYELVDGSPAINAGDLDLTPEVTTDLNGKERNSKPDLGAVESDVPATVTLCVNLLEDQSGEWDGGTVLSLRQALDYANNRPEEEYEITFDSSLKGKTILLVNDDLEISRPITINALDQNITVSGGGNSRIFNITASDVTVEGLTLTNGSSDEGGAVRIAEGVSANFNACVFTSNTSSTNGGAVYMDEGSNVTFTNSVFSGNIAGNRSSIKIKGSGSAIYAYGETTTLTLQHVTVVSNTSVGLFGSYGGGIYLCKSAGNIYNSIILSNTANSGANVFATEGATVIASNVLTSNSGTRWYYKDGATLTLTNIISVGSSTTSSDVLNTKTFKLVDGCAAIDAGDPELTPEVTTDLYGNDRDAKPDLGACEYVASSSAVIDDVFAELVDDLEIEW